MSTRIYCDECGQPLLDNTSAHALSAHALGVQGKTFSGRVDIIVYKYDAANARFDGRPDLCLPCLKNLVKAATPR
jgi:hypothetical protein